MQTFPPSILYRSTDISRRRSDTSWFDMPSLGRTKTRETVEPGRVPCILAELYVPLLGFTLLQGNPHRSLLKRSLRPGFAGVVNDLYYNPKCLMLFEVAKDSLNGLLSALK
jgi:hypothetical protein